MPSTDNEQTFNDRLRELVERLEAAADAYCPPPLKPKPGLQLVKDDDDA